MTNTKGIILAGGYGSRLYPLTFRTSKQLLPVYDKPMIYYPLSTLMNAGIRDILIISTEKDIPRFKDLLNDGSNIGISITYKVQKEPRGIAEAFLIGANFIKNDNVCLILGDNIFYGKNFNMLLEKAISNFEKGFSSIFGVKVDNPSEFGVIEFDSNNSIKRIIEKPHKTQSNYIVSGLYFYTNNVIEVASNLTRSVRGELEITDINNYYLNQKKLDLCRLDSNFSWLDTGTYNSLIEASRYFQDHEKQTGEKIACIEEVALKLNLIDKSKFIDIANTMSTSNYGKYLLAKAKNY